MDYIWLMSDLRRCPYFNKSVGGGMGGLSGIGLVIVVAVAGVAVVGGDMAVYMAAVSVDGTAAETK
jgi:hypothetical protein